MTPTWARTAAKSVGALELAGGDEEASVGAAVDGEAGGGGVAVGDEEFGRGDEVVEDVLLVLAGAGLVPPFAELAAAAEGGLGEDAAELHPEDAGGGELGHERDAEAAVAVEQGGVGAVEREVAAVGDEHGQVGAVGGGDVDLGGFEVGGVEAEVRRAEHGGGAGGHVEAVDGAGGGEVGEDEEGFGVGALAGEAGDGADAGEREALEEVAFGRVELDEALGAVEVGGDEGVR